jgi:hypothetical protein
MAKVSEYFGVLGMWGVCSWDECNKYMVFVGPD